MTLPSSHRRPARRGWLPRPARNVALACGAALLLSVASVALLAGAAPGIPAVWGARSLRRLESGKKRDDVLMPLLDLRPNARKRPNAIALCFEFSTILNTGGVEAWYWSLFDAVFKHDPFVVHAVQVRTQPPGTVGQRGTRQRDAGVGGERAGSGRARSNGSPPSARSCRRGALVGVRTLPASRTGGLCPALCISQINDLHSVEVVAHFARESVMFNPGHQYLADTCDVIVSTGSQPLHTYNFQRRAPRVLVVHGAKGCQWTWRYAQHADKYDRIVGVSKGAVDVYDSLPEQQQRVVVIPSGINVKALVPSASRDALLREFGVPQPAGLRVLLYLGRISSEKNPQFFYDVVNELPPNWIGLMVGPAYFDARCGAAGGAARGACARERARPCV